MRGLLVSALVGLACAVLAADLVTLAEVPKTAPMPQAGRGEMVWRSGSYVVRLTDEPCRFADFREQLEDEGIPPARAFMATQAGRPTVAGCWAHDIAGDVILRDPTSSPDALPVSIRWFERERGA